jgi:excisionase family DNA binding protein
VTDTPELPPGGSAASEDKSRLCEDPRPALDRLMTADEVADMLAVPERWIREHTRSGLIPHVQLGRYARYRRDAVLIWLEECESGGAPWRRHRPVRPAGTK